MPQSPVASFTEAQVIAAMRAVEEETIQRCVKATQAYAARKNDSMGKPSSRIAAAKQLAAQEIASEIEKLPRKKIG